MQVLHMLYSSETRTWHALEKYDTLLKPDQLMPICLGVKAKKLLRKLLPKWMKHFFHFKSLLPFIFDEEKMKNKNENL